MELRPNASISRLPEEFVITDLGHGGEEEGTNNGGFSELLSQQQTLGGDESSGWLSMFEEDCLSSSGKDILSPENDEVIAKTSQSNSLETRKPQFHKSSPVKHPEISRKKRKKRKTRFIMQNKPHKKPSLLDLVFFSPDLDLELIELELEPDPPLLQQAHWLADSEPIFPIRMECCEETGVNVLGKGRDFDSPSPSPELYMEAKMDNNNNNDNNNNSTNNNKKKVSKVRRCSHCQTEKTPLWRQGPLGKGTLCNACGVRWIKSGSLFPEYRPANSPTFVSHLHSNVLRKVLQMREARSSSSTDEQ